MAQFDDDTQWTNFDGNPEFNGFVRAMVLDDLGNLYCGGDFTSVDGITANRVAMWNGVTWSALGGGLNNQVRCLAYSNGNLYAGGQFTQADGTPANNIAMWNGTAWSALSVGTSGDVFSLTVIDDDLYAGGFFKFAGGIVVNNIARWDGEEWNALGSGTNNTVFAMTSNGGNLIAGGRFTLANGDALNRIGQWNGTEWTALGSGLNLQVFALHQSGTDLYVGGEFTQAGGFTGGKRIARWDGTNWHTLGDGYPFDVYAITSNDEDVFIGTANSIAQWNGSRWLQLGSGANGVVRALTNDRLNVYLGGDFTTAGNKPSDYAAEVIYAFKGSLSVELPEATRLANEEEIDYGSIAIDSTDGRYVFTLRNIGNIPLTISNIGLAGSDDLEFFDLQTADALGVLAPDAKGTFTVTFLPTEAGEKSASLEITSDDPDKPTFTLELKASGATAREIYDAVIDETDLMDFDTLPDSIPFDDGIENILKYGFNMNLDGPDSATLEMNGESGLPVYSIVEDAGTHYLRFEFLRRKGSGLIYTPLKSPDLVTRFSAATGSETIEDIDRQWERVFFDVPVDLTTDPTCFGRVEVELPVESEP